MAGATRRKTCWQWTWMSGGSLATVEDAGWPVDMCGFEDVVNCRLLSAFRLIERSKVDFGLLERYTASRCRKQPLHDVANRITDQPGKHLNKLQLLLPAAAEPWFGSSVWSRYVPLPEAGASSPELFGNTTRQKRAFMADSIFSSWRQFGSSVWSRYLGDDASAAGKHRRSGRRCMHLTELPSFGRGPISSESHSVLTAACL
eukprot:s2323_g6.t2